MPDGPAREEATMLIATRRRIPLTSGAAACAVSFAVASLCPPARAGSAPENLALKAKATASSEYSNQYVARFACDGKIPSAGDRADVGKSWVAKGNRHPGGVLYTLEWAEPVTVAEIVYYGRTSFDTNENWKDYEVYLDAAKPGSDKPAAKGKLERGHGPQRMKLAKPTSARRITLKFLSSYGGPNPGANEIQVYAASPPQKLLGKFTKPSAAPRKAYQAPPPPRIKESPELAARLKAGELGFTKLVVTQRHHIRCSHVYTYHCEGQKNGGGLFIYDVTDGSMKKLVDTSDGQIQACDLSYDGKTILFGWRRPGSRFYQLWSIGVDGEGLKQLTEGNGYNYDGAWMPDGRIVFLSTRVPQAAYCFFTPVGILYTMNADGSDQRKISANYLNDFTPAITNDGRIIYGRWEYVDRPAIPIQSLWTINPDGTMLQGFFGNRVLDPASFMEPQPIPGSNAILCTMTGHNGSCRGAIGIIDPSHGNNAQESIRNLTPEVGLRGVNISTNGPRGPYQTPYPVDEKYFLVSHDGTLLLRDYDCTEQTVALAPRGIGYYNPRPLRARPRPPVRPSNLMAELPGSGPGIARKKESDNGVWASVYVQDIYNGLEPHVKRGEIKQIAVVQEIRRSLINSPGIHRPAFDFQRVLVSCGATYVPKKVWGYAEVSEDGSAYFKVPAELPIYFMVLDAKGRALQRMRSFTHLMPGEVQGCIGCHESRSLRPRARFPLRRLAREPQELTPPEWGTVGFNYATIVQPVLDKHCVRCHNPRGPKDRVLQASAKLGPPKGVDLTGDRTDFFNMSYEVLARRNQGRTGSPYISWIPVYNGHEWNIGVIAPKKWGSPASRLADIILTNHPDADSKPRVKLDEPSRRRVLTWIDLNVPYYGTADTAHPDLPACRQMMPRNLRRVMDGVYARRCNSCHSKKRVRIKMPWHGHSRRTWGELGVRVQNPQLNAFLLAPLAKSAGGTGACGEPVFADGSDPDYQAVLKTFEPVNDLMRRRPRMDMPGAVPSASCFAGKGAR
jgi:hypothetical protein